MGHERDEVAKCEGETGSQSSEGTHDKSTCFVLQMSQGDESQVRHFCGKFQISFYAGKMSQPNTPVKDEGRAEERRIILVVSAICTDFIG